jgi:hypothetical protein
LKQLIDKCKAQGLNPVGIKLDDEHGVEIIMERNTAYIEQYEKDNNNSK